MSNAVNTLVTESLFPFHSIGSVICIYYPNLQDFPFQREHIHITNVIKQLKHPRITYLNSDMNLSAAFCVDDIFLQGDGGETPAQ